MVGMVLGLALLAVALVQGRQATLLNQTVQMGDDYVVLNVFQAETEFLRLLDTWHQATADQEPLDATALQLRYDVWVSRIGLLHDSRTWQIMSSQPDYIDTLQRIDQFIRQADRLLGEKPQQRLTRQALLALQTDLENLAAPTHGMTLRAAHHVGDQVTARNATVRRHNQFGIGLTAFLTALTLAFAYISLRQVRQLEQRRASLEQLAASLRVARRDAEAASAAKSTFLANMSHEIRTPFQGLMGMLALLRETGLNPRQIDYLRTATESADHLLALLNDILDMSQLESGRMVLDPGAVDLRALLREVEALMRPAASAKQLALHVDATPEVPERVLADGTRVRQVAFNLLSNAIKFSDHGAVVLDLRVAGAGTAQPMLEFVVSDQGVGIDDNTMATLFSRFVQGDNSRSRRHGGTGLGLEISRNLARLMGGDITVRSQPGEGSVFTFRMPLQAAPALAHAHTELAGETEPGARRLHVLVAEDHPINRQFLAALLEGLGHTAHFTANGEEAVAAMRQTGRGFDLVLMDLHMPVLDGVGATRAIRALPQPELATVPIVALTADAFAETRERCLLAGLNDFLTQPVSPPKLAAALRRLFGSAPTPDPALAASHPVAPLPSRLLDSPPLLDPVALAQGRHQHGETEFAQRVHDFLAQGPRRVATLRDAVRHAQTVALQQQGEQLRSEALALGLSALAATADALLQGAAHLPAHEVARHVQRFEDLLPRTRAAADAAGLTAA
ncbi:MAG: ATP-binding protein [Rubrivivax sp.]